MMTGSKERNAHQEHRLELKRSRVRELTVEVIVDFIRLAKGQIEGQPDFFSIEWIDEFVPDEEVLVAFHRESTVTTICD